MANRADAQNSTNENPYSLYIPSAEWKTQQPPASFAAVGQIPVAAKRNAKEIVHVFEIMANELLSLQRFLAISSRDVLPL